MSFAKRTLEPYNLGPNQKMMLSGFFAGLCYSNVAFIFDLLKVRAQFRQKERMRYTDEIRRIYATEGLRGFYSGYQGMLLRDGPGFCFYFTVYEMLKRANGVADHDKESADFAAKSSFEVQARLFVCGGSSGVMTWFLCYPADFLKTRLQTQPPGVRKGLFKIAGEIWAEHGLMHLYKGIHVQLLRSFPSSATGMLVFEQVKGFLSSLD